MNKLYLTLASLLLLVFASTAFSATAYEFDASVEVFERGEKPRVAVDRFGRFYTVAQDIAATTSTIRYAYSTDFSLTEWNALRNVISAADVYELPDIAVDDNGMVHVTFAYTDSSSRFYAEYRSARSFDESFSASVIAGDVGTEAATNATRSDIVAETYLGTVYVYTLQRNDSSDSVAEDNNPICSVGTVRSYATSFAAPSTNNILTTQDETGRHALTALELAGDSSRQLYAVWEYANDVYFDTGSDEDSWTADVTVSANTALTNEVDIAAGDDNWDADGNDDVIVVWSDRRNGYSDIYADWSRDAGTTWQTDIRVLGTATRYYDQDSPSVTMGQEDGKVHLTWRDMRHGTSSIYYIQGIYSAAGISWGVDADEDGVMDSGEVDDVLQVDDDSNDAVQKDPCVAVDRYGNVIVAWHDTFTGNIRSAALLYNVD